MNLGAMFRYFTRSAWLGLRTSPFMQAIAVGTLAVALFTTGLARGAMKLLVEVQNALGSEIQMTVYLSDAMDPVLGAEVAKIIASKAGAPTSYITPDEAMRRLAAELGDVLEPVAGLSKNPLPASVELIVPPSSRGTAELAALAEEIRRIDGVTAIDYGEEAVRRLGTISRALRIGGGIAFAVIAIATIIITAATLQLAIYARREEIEIQKLVGATDRFVKTPFLLEGLLQGLAGGSFAIFGLWAFAVWGGPKLDGALSFLLGSTRPWSLFDPRAALELLILGCALGLVGSFVAVGRFLRV